MVETIYSQCASYINTAFSHFVFNFYCFVSCVAAVQNWFALILFVFEKQRYPLTKVNGWMLHWWEKAACIWNLTARWEYYPNLWGMHLSNTTRELLKNNKRWGGRWWGVMMCLNESRNSINLLSWSHKTPPPPLYFLSALSAITSKWVLSLESKHTSRNNESCDCRWEERLWNVRTMWMEVIVLMTSSVTNTFISFYLAVILISWNLAQNCSCQSELLVGYFNSSALTLFWVPRE